MTPSPVPNETVPVVATTPTEPTPTPATSTREAIYARYYEPQPSAPVVEPTPVAVEPPAQGVTPSEPAAPVVTPEPNPQPDLTAVVSSLMAEITQLRQQLTPQPQPTQPPAPVESPTPQEDWYELLRTGDKKGFERALANTLKSDVGPDVVQSSIVQALDVFRAENEITSFVQDLRSKNPDLVPFEKYIGFETQAALAAARDANQINSTKDYITIYKRAVNDAAANARNLIQQLRGAGKQEAMTTKTEVLSASTLAPSAVQPHGGATPPAEPQTDSTADYLARRKQMLMHHQRLAP